MRKLLYSLLRFLVHDIKNETDGIYLIENMFKYWIISS